MTRTTTAARRLLAADPGRRVYLHCVGARSRTPTVAAAYLAATRSIPGPVALAQVSQVLAQAAPNATFRAAVDAIGAAPAPDDPRTGQA